MQESNKLQVKERVIVEKYDGDPPKKGEIKEPVETIIIDDGIIIDRITKKGN